MLWKCKEKVIRNNDNNKEEGVKEATKRSGRRRRKKKIKCKTPLLAQEENKHPG